MTQTKRVVNVILCILWNIHNYRSINEKVKKALLKAKMAKIIKESNSQEQINVESLRTKFLETTKLPTTHLTICRTVV